MSNSQEFLKQLDKKLWTAADKLRANLDAAVYKHAVLGLIFLKYVSDAFLTQQTKPHSLLLESYNANESIVQTNAIQRI